MWELVTCPGEGANVFPAEWDEAKGCEELIVTEHGNQNIYLINGYNLYVAGGNDLVITGNLDIDLIKTIEELNNKEAQKKLGQQN